MTDRHGFAGIAGTGGYLDIIGLDNIAEFSACLSTAEQCRRKLERDCTSARTGRKIGDYIGRHTRSFRRFGRYAVNAAYLLTVGISDQAGGLSGLDIQLAEGSFLLETAEKRILSGRNGPEKTVGSGIESSRVSPSIETVRIVLLMP